MRRAVIEYREPSRSSTALGNPGLVAVQRETYEGAEWTVRGRWLVATTGAADVAFYPEGSVIRAWHEEAALDAAMASRATAEEGS